MITNATAPRREDGALMRESWTLSLSWGPSGGFYVARYRICLWRLAFTFVPKVEIDAMMRAYVDWNDQRPAGKTGR